MGAKKWVYGVLTIWVLFLVVGAGRANVAFARGTNAVLKNPMVEGVLFRFLEVSPARLSAMGVDGRRELLERKLNSLEDKGLATDIERVFRGVSEGRPGIEGEIESLLARMPSKKVSVQDFLGNKKTSALEVLRARAQKGEFASRIISDFSETLRNARRALGFDILGSDAGTCLGTFPAAEVKNFMTLVSSLRNPGALSDVNSAFRAMVSESGNLFGEGPLKAQKRICGLAGRGYKCNALAPQMCVL